MEVGWSWVLGVFTLEPNNAGGAGCWGRSLWNLMVVGY